MTRRQDVLLAALAASPTRTLTPVQLQKALFLVAQEAKSLAPTSFYAFEKYNYGPFSSEIYDDIGGLRQLDLVEIVHPSGSWVRHYQLTEKGVEHAAEIQGKLKPKLVRYLSDVTKWVTSLDFQSLVRAIYKKYPEYRKNSIFRG
jgi:uncharacterized protein YwgA